MRKKFERYQKQSLELQEWMEHGGTDQRGQLPLTPPASPRELLYYLGRIHGISHSLLLG